MIDQLKKWNTEDPPQSKNDYRFALAILLSLTNPDEISNGTVSDNVMQFIMDLLQLRTNGDITRFEQGINAVQKYCRDNEFKP